MKQKYIKGNIVMYDNRIHTIMDTLELNNYELSYIEHPVHQLELSGVLLTPEILEKDGFEVRYSGMYYTKSINCRCGFLQRYIAIERKNNDWAVFIKYKSISDYALLCHIKYVHQLQNLLFGLGLNSEMEV